MKNDNINENLAINITMNVVLITAISLLMEKGFFQDENYVNAISEFYGVSLIFLILLYVTIESNREIISENTLLRIKKDLLLNVTLSSVVLGASMYPQFLYSIGGQYLFVTTVIILITINITLPLVLFLWIFGTVMYRFGYNVRLRLKRRNTKMPNNKDILIKIIKYIPLLSLTLISFLLMFLLVLVMSSSNSNRDLLDYATLGLLILTVITYYSQMHVSERNVYNTIIQTSRTKQLENLYIPLCGESPNFENVDIKEIEKYSYLASNELEKYIENFIECFKRPHEFTVHERKETFDNVNNALKIDIPKIKEDLGIYLKK